MKSCIALAGSTTIVLIVAEVGAAACANATDSESKKVSAMRTTDKIIIRGGSKETRSQPLYDKSKELVQQLMNEPIQTHSSIQHTFRAIWKVYLESSFPIWITGTQLLL